MKNKKPRARDTGRATELPPTLFLFLGAGEEVDDEQNTDNKTKTDARAEFHLTPF